MTDLLYNEKTLIGRLYHYFYNYFQTCCTPTAQTLILLLLSILALESANSIRFLYRHFLSKLTEKSLNAFYYACSYAKVDYSRFMNVTASMTLKLIPKPLETQPVFYALMIPLSLNSGKSLRMSQNCSTMLHIMAVAT